MQTDRLILRRSRREDASVIYERYHQDPRVAHYLTWRPSATIEQTYAFLERCEARWDVGDSFPWMVTLTGDDNPIGMIEMRISRHGAELGYVLARAYWNKGYMTEAIKAVTAWAMVQPDIYRVWAVCDIENTASVRVLEKAGFRREGVLRRWLVHPNVSEEPRDCFCYAIVK